MRRRRSLEVWPSYADLMTVLAVIGLLIGAGLLRRDRTSPATQESLRRHVAELENRHSQDLERLTQLARLAAANQKMSQAIAEAQRRIDEIAQHSPRLRFSADQSLEFGNDLVTFETNGVEPTTWLADARTQLRDFCVAISAALAREEAAAAHGAPATRSMFYIEVEGHTDSQPCMKKGDSMCNWIISSGRAAKFVEYMRRPDYCPGGAAFRLRPIGYADTRPRAPGLPPTRRIAVRLTPDYARIIAGLQQVAAPPRRING